jgi:hypothetical protein
LSRARRPDWRRSGHRDRRHKAAGQTRAATSTLVTRRSREILEDAHAVDAAEDEAFGEARGDEVPPELDLPVSVDTGLLGGLGL